MPDGACRGTVHGLKGHTVCFTGRVLVDGVWTVRATCSKRAAQRGAVSKTDFSRKVTLVVYGDLASKAVTDDSRAYSSTLVDAEAERSRGRHVCVVDADGFSELLKGRPAPCLKLRKARTGRVRPVAAHTPKGGILGGPLRVRRTGQRLSGDLTLDLSALDRATTAHETTVGTLIAYLSRQGIEACAHAPGAPQFDAGWHCGQEVFVAEVKSLTGAHEEQQIRLGIGQLLDYTQQLRIAHPSTLVHPVLILEKSPSADRWVALARSVGLRLAWAPDFAGL